MWGAHEGMGWWMLLGSMWFVVFWGVVIWLIATLVSRSDRRSARREDEAVEIARERFARGEMSRDEFERLVQDLRRHR